MQLVAFSCQNIGPFFDRTISVSFEHGKFLIKAPIGLGKSFLFFDGPVFGIYRYSTRPMLSIKATSGRIKVLCEHEGKLLCIIRNITRSKSGNDTVKSQLYVSDEPLEHIVTSLKNEGILTEGKDIFPTLLNTFQWETVESKNESDVQGTVESFLPPKEVFLSTSVLMQDSENVFELTPADRINLLKEIFGLLSIDSATEKINDRKKEVSTLLKSKQGTEDIDKKLREYLHYFLQYGRDLAKYGVDTKFEKSLEEIELVVDKVGITGFNWDSHTTTLLENIQSTIALDRARLQEQLGAIKARQKERDEHITLGKKLQQDLGSTDRLLQTYQQQLSSNNTDELEHHEQEKELYAQKFSAREKTLPQERFIDGATSIADVAQHLQHTIAEGKNLRQQLEATQNEKTLLIANKDSLQKRIDQNTEKVSRLQQDLGGQQKYFCDEERQIECRFAKELGGGFAKKTASIIDEIAKDNKELQQQITIQDTHIKTADEKTLTLEQEVKTLQQNPLIANHKDIQQAYETYKEFLATQKKLLEKDSYYQAQIQAREKIRIDIARKESEKEQLTLQLHSREQKNQIISLADSIQETSNIENNLQQLTTKADLVQRLLTGVDRIGTLIEQHKDTMREIKKLEEQLGLLTDLYRIFSKEIMIKVLEDALPFFAEYVNNLLAKMAQFTIHFTPRKTTSDKLELDISIRDDHGERSVKSLSGGQKAILRLAWILGVAQMTGASQLFLDETINNIDQNTISSVATMLEDYLKMNPIAFYLVTHSSQLQDMEIWDRTIELQTMVQAD